MMPKCSAIQEYYLCRQGLRLADDKDISNDDLHRLLLEMRDERIRDARQNEYLLEIIRRQSKPQFWREVGANLTADAIFEVAMRLGSKILRI